VRNPYRNHSLAFLFLLLVACGDKVEIPPAPSTTTVPKAPSVHAVTVTPASATLNTGDKITLASSVDADSGISDRTVTWTSSNTAIAAVDANGVVTGGTTAGTVTIVATSKADGTVKGAAVITVLPPGSGSPATVTVSSIATTLAVVSDPAGHDQFTRYSTVKQIQMVLDASKGTVDITGDAPWVEIKGTVSNNAVTANGSGTVAGFSNVSVSFQGTLSNNNNNVQGTVVLGPGLPQNQNETLSLTGTKK
jgi:Bacterial Ig-like domain (group 2)